MFNYVSIYIRTYILLLCLHKLLSGYTCCIQAKNSKISSISIALQLSYVDGTISENSACIRKLISILHILFYDF